MRFIGPPRTGCTSSRQNDRIGGAHTLVFPSARANLRLVYSGRIGNSFDPNGFSIGSSRRLGQIDQLTRTAEIWSFQRKPFGDRASARVRMVVAITLDWPPN